MKYKFPLPALAALLAFLIYFSSCTKKHLPPSQGNNTVSCRISKMIFLQGEFNLPDTLVFAYDANGNLISMRHSHVTDTQIDVVLSYDSHNRLVEYKRQISPGNTQDWVKINPIGGNQPVADSDYQYPDPDFGATPPERYDVLDLANYQYDVKGRIIHTTDRFIDVVGADTINTDYIYTSQGNLTGLTYDDKVNYLRTNPVLQYLLRDYSQNNELSDTEIDSYNENGLPTHLLHSTFPANIKLFDFFGFGVGKETYIEYECSGGNTTTPLKK
jgi:hypothetical protein